MALLLRNGISLAILASMLCVATPASCLLGQVEIQAGWEQGGVRFGELASFLQYRLTDDTVLDVPQEVRYGLRNESVRGLRLALAMGPDFDVTWSRLEANSRYEIDIDGERVQHDPDAGFANLIPNVDVRLDLISAGFRIRRWSWAGFTPTVRAGFGWALVSQDGPVQFLHGPLAKDNSDSDHAYEAGVGLDWSWRRLRGGIDLRTVFWRFEVKDDRIGIPEQMTHALMLSARLGVGF